MQACGERKWSPGPDWTQRSPGRSSSTSSRSSSSRHSAGRWTPSQKKNANTGRNQTCWTKWRPTPRSSSPGNTRTSSPLLTRCRGWSLICSVSNTSTRDNRRTTTLRHLKNYNRSTQNSNPGHVVTTKPGFSDSNLSSYKT